MISRPVLVLVFIFAHVCGLIISADESCADGTAWPETNVRLLMRATADMGSPSRPDVLAALTEAQGNVGKAAAALRRSFEHRKTTDESVLARQEADAAAATVLQVWNATDRGTVVVVDDFVSTAELNHLATMFEVAREHGQTRWDHGAIKGPQGSVGHTTAGVLVDRRGSHAPLIGPETRAAFCAVRQRMIECAQAVGSGVLLPRGRRTRLADHDPDVVPDYTALLQYRPGGRHDRHVDTDVAGRCLSMALHLNDGFGESTDPRTHQLPSNSLSTD